MPDQSCFIDGFGPLRVECPESTGRLCELVQAASQREESLYALGGGTTLDFGNPPQRPGFALDMRRLDQVIDYPARDMTITVQAGITVSRLQAVLAPEKQRLPIDVPRSEEATLGGVLAANISGPRRYGYGTLRDYVLGISVVNDEGQEIKAGGRVVKNVAGYDLCKLFVGSLGTLGIITQVTLKLRPLPDQCALVALACSSAILESVLETLHRSRTRPVCIDALNRAACLSVLRGIGADADWTVLVGFEGNAEAVQWQVQQLIREVKGSCTLDARMGACGGPLWQALAEFPALRTREGESLTFKANLLPGGVAAFCGQLNAMPERPLVQAHAGNGIVVGHFGIADGQECPSYNLTAERAAGVVERIRGLVRPFQGRVVVLRCPSAWKRDIDVWGPPSGDIALMRAIKNKLDPRGLFNPGRFLDGI